MTRKATSPSLDDVVDGHDVGVAESGGGSGLAEEALGRAAGAVGALQQQLDGNLALEHLVVGLVDDAHAAGTELAQQPVLAELPDRRPVESRRLVGGGVARHWTSL